MCDEVVNGTEAGVSATSKTVERKREWWILDEVGREDGMVLEEGVEICMEGAC